MKTYTEKVEKPRLVISYDSFPESPRAWDNLGLLITKERNRQSPDTSDYYSNLIVETEDLATSSEDHMERIKKASSGDVLYISPVCRYEHGGVKYFLGTAQGFDYSNCGFYIITQESWNKIFGDIDFDLEIAKQVIEAELDAYNTYVNGQVYEFRLYNEVGGLEEYCSGIYNLEDIKDVLPEEWKDENMEDYLVQY